MSFQVRIEMSATLDARSLRWQEGWFKVNDGSKSLATEGPYIMKKTQKVKTPKYVSQPTCIDSKNNEMNRLSKSICRNNAEGSHFGFQLPYFLFLNMTPKKLNSDGK